MKNPRPGSERHSSLLVRVDEQVFKWDGAHWTRDGRCVSLSIVELHKLQNERMRGRSFAKTLFEDLEMVLTRCPLNDRDQAQLNRLLFQFPTEQGLRSEMYLQYTLSEHWLSFRETLFALVGKLCEACGSNSSAQVHHFSYANLGRESIEEVGVLCEQCHWNAHHQNRDSIREAVLKARRRRDDRK